MKIAIIGAGNVGTNLQHALELKGIRSELFHARELLDGTYSDPVIHTFDVYVYTVIDDAIKDVAAQVKAPNALHLHTSGTVPIDIFDKDKVHTGVIYFFQSFSKESLIDDWSVIPCFIEGRNIDDVAAIFSLAQILTSRIYETTQHDRERLHVAGVFANNYTNLMYRIAEWMLQDTQIPFAALLPLIDQTAVKMHTLSPKNAQTGPAIRKDQLVLAHHMFVLDQMKDGTFMSSDLQMIYMCLAHLISTADDPVEEKESILERFGQVLSELGEKAQNRPIPARRHKKRR
jgi:predicted short-subunit dehydrogenase-like oxidoreductase (DUF2520 family)